VIKSLVNSSTKETKAPIIPQNVMEYIHKLLSPFLRCSALFLLACLDKKAPEIPLDDDYEYDEVKYLSGYLHLPSIQDIFNEFFSTSLIRPMVMDWVNDFRKQSDSLPDLIITSPFKLIELPANYHDLLQKYSKLRCVNCKSVPITKTLCLVCGKLVCAGNSCCRNLGVGECSSHARSCGSGVGLFLLLKTSEVLVISHSRHSFWGSPYLDEYGEEDINLMRGKSLFFNKERYEQLTQLYLSQRLEYDSKIVESSTLDETGWY